MQTSKFQQLVGITIVILAFILVHHNPSHPGQLNSSQEAIMHGLDYVDKSPDVSPVQWLLMDYLARKFELDSKFLAANRNFQLPTEPQAAAEFQTYRRIAYPDQLVDSLPSDNDPTNRMVMEALHCDHIPLPADFTQLIQSNTDAGGYQLTHVAFSLERMNENGCPLPADQDQKLRDQLKVGMVDIIDNPNTDPETGTGPDLRYEALAMLMHIGYRDQVKQSWIEQIIKEQSSDGGWKNRFDATEDNDHATVLALWALLEYSQPGVASEPMLHHPVPSVASR